MSRPLDQATEGLVLAMQTKEMADKFLDLLDKNAMTDSERMLAKDTRVVVETQNKIIALLVEHSLTVLEHFEEFLDKIDPPE
jgi:hydrogenase maturation factor